MSNNKGEILARNSTDNIPYKTIQRNHWQEVVITMIISIDTEMSARKLVLRDKSLQGYYQLVILKLSPLLQQNVGQKSLKNTQINLAR